MTEKMDKFLGIKPPKAEIEVSDKAVAAMESAVEGLLKTIAEEVEDEDILAAAAEKPSKKARRK